jgi:4-hydroxybenzoate polyprenyltransferase
MDKDKESIGMIEHPEEVPEQMLWVTIFLDGLAVLLTVLFFHWDVVGLLFLYIAASRLYSYRPIRLKKYAVTGFLTVTVFQGPVIYWMTRTGTTTLEIAWNIPVYIGMAVSFLLIAAGYPISQIYQHRQDKEDGVHTISMLLGVKGTFIFSMMMFGLLNVLMAVYCIWIIQDISLFWWFLAITGPVLFYFIYWMRLCFKNPDNANFKNTMRLNILGAVCNNLFFILLLFKTILFD